ncbi:MAG: DHHW family protein [Ruminococcus sp.]
MRKKDDYFIGMVDTYSANQKYKKMKKKAKTKRVFIRVLIIALCVLLAAGIGAAVYFFAVPAIKQIDFSSIFASSTEDEATTAATVSEETTVPLTTAAPTEPTTVPQTTAPAEKADALTFIKPQIEDKGGEGTLYSSTLYIWNNRGFNLFHSGDKAAKYYAKAVNTLSESLDKDITVYNMVVPNQTEYGLPQRIIDSGIETDSQADNIKCIYENLGKRVVPVNCYNELSSHANEYIYYRTDHHWTSLGAYYAYLAFCDTASLTPLDIAKLDKNEIDGFTGSFYGITSSSELYANADTVTYYTLPGDTYAYMKERMSSDTIKVGVYYPASTGGSLTYGVFCWGDTAQFVIHSDAGTGRKIAVVKDSYGNAFAPYLTANYDEIHLLDLRYWSSNLNDYLKENGIKEVLILNNTMSANNTSQVDQMLSVAE